MAFRSWTISWLGEKGAVTFCGCRAVSFTSGIGIPSSIYSIDRVDLSGIFERAHGSHNIYIYIFIYYILILLLYQKYIILFNNIICFKNKIK